MSSSKLLVLDAASRMREIQIGHKKKLDSYHQLVRRLKNECFLRKVQVKRGGKSYIYHKYYRYGYFKVEDDGEAEVVISSNLSNVERYRFIRGRGLKRRMVYVGADKPRVVLPDPPEDPLAGLRFERKKDSIIVDKEVYIKHRDLFRDLEAFELK